MYYYGKNTIKGLVASKKAFAQIYISENFNDKNFLNYLKTNRLKYEIVNDHFLDKLSEKSNHQGVLAVGFEFEYQNLDVAIKKNEANENSLFILLDGLEDPQNLGSIARTGEALQISGIIIPKNRSVKVTPTVAKVSTGAIDNLDIIQVTNLSQSITKLKDAGYWIVGADMHTDVAYDKIDYNMKIALVIGSEGKGISINVLKACDYVVKIPMYGQVSSLNAAVSAAIIMYQINSSRLNK